MGPAQRLSHLLVICGVYQAAVLADSEMVKVGRHMDSRDICLGNSSDSRNANSTVSDKKLCDKNQGNCTVRLDSLRISMDDINSSYFVQFPHLKELKIQGSQVVSTQPSPDKDLYCLPDNIFCSLPNLTSFSVVDVPLRREALLFFETPCQPGDNTDLRHLQLSGDSIHVVPPHIGAYLPRLQHLDLSSNFIKSVPRLEVLNRFDNTSTDLARQRNESQEVSDSLVINLSNNSLTLLPVDIFPHLDEPTIQDDQGPPKITINLENNPDLICVPPTPDHIKLTTERYIPECCCNPLASSYMHDSVRCRDHCEFSNTSIALSKAQNTDGDDGSPALKFALTISGLPPNCSLGQPVMIEFSSYAQVKVLPGELVPLNRQCSCQFFGVQNFAEEPSELVHSFISFTAKPSISPDGSNSSRSIEVEIPYPSSAKNSMFCIQNALLGIEKLSFWENSMCIDLSENIPIDDDTYGDVSPPDDMVFNVVVVDESESVAQPDTHTSSSPHSHVKFLLWLIAAGGIIAVVFIAIIGLYSCKIVRRRAVDQPSRREHDLRPEDCELLSAGEPVSETLMDRQQPQHPPMDTENSSHPSTVARPLSSIAGSLSRLAMLFEFHHQNTQNSSRIVVGRAAESSEAFESSGLVMGCALDHMNL